MIFNDKPYLRALTDFALGCAALLVAGTALAAPLKVVTTMPELAEIVRDVGQGEVKATALLAGTENPHYLDAQPNFVTAVRDADAVCLIGLELENSWMDKVLAKSGNAAIQKGGKGYCETGKTVDVIEDDHHHGADRSHGHVHAAGNPHFNLSPIALKQAAKTVYNTLVALRPAKTAVFKKGLKQFGDKMAAIDTAIKSKFDAYLRKNATPPLIIEYHEEFPYLFKAYNINTAGAIESMPGVPPSATELAKKAVEAKSRGVTLAIGSLYSPEKHLKKFSQFSGIPYVKLPSMVQRDSKTLGTIKQLQEYLAKTILESKQLKTAAR